MKASQVLVRSLHSLRLLRNVSCASLRAYSCALPRAAFQTLKRGQVFSAPCFGQIRTTSSSTKPIEPTIYALSTSPGRAAIAIIRISGSACLDIYQALCPSKKPPQPRHATLRTLYEPSKPPGRKSVLDANALVLYFPAPETSTGEDVLEFHVHGGPAVVKAVLASIPKAGGGKKSQSIRYAEPGEFTRRAFYNDRLDLLQIEALSDTLAADTEQQRRLAVRGSTSGRAQVYDSWRQSLVDARGELEALIDFSEDQHFDESPAQLCASVAKQVRLLKSQLRAHVENATRGELLRNGISIALLGAPNVGKSTLLNQIVGREAAIVSSEAGTTRDVVDVNVDIGGFFCRFGDLAGLRGGAQMPGSRIGEIEKEGMRRAKERALTADVVLVVLPVLLSDQNGGKAGIEIDSEVLEVLEQCNLEEQKIVFVVSRTDLFEDAASMLQSVEQIKNNPMLARYTHQSRPTLYTISCKDAQDTSSHHPDPGRIQNLLNGLKALFETMTSATVQEDRRSLSDNSTWTESLGATERQRILLQRCLQYLHNFMNEVQSTDVIHGHHEEKHDEADIVIAAEHLRSAAECLSKITGKGEAGDVEEILGVVFEK